MYQDTMYCVFDAADLPNWVQTGSVTKGKNAALDGEGLRT